MKRKNPENNNGKEQKLWYRRGFMQIPILIMEHPLWKTEDGRTAILGLLELAQYKDTKVKTPKGELELKAGEVYASIRFLAERWGWKRDKVHRILKRMEEEKMIKRRTLRGESIISVLYHCAYDVSRDLADNDNQTESRTAKTEENRTVKNKENETASRTVNRTVKIDTTPFNKEAYENSISENRTVNRTLNETARIDENRTVKYEENRTKSRTNTKYINTSNFVRSSDAQKQMSKMKLISTDSSSNQETVVKSPKSIFDGTEYPNDELLADCQNPDRPPVPTSKDLRDSVGRDGKVTGNLHPPQVSPPPPYTVVNQSSVIVPIETTIYPDEFYRRKDSLIQRFNEIDYVVKYQNFQFNGLELPELITYFHYSKPEHDDLLIAALKKASFLRKASQNTPPTVRVTFEWVLKHRQQIFEGKYEIDNSKGFDNAKYKNLSSAEKFKAATRSWKEVVKT